MNLVFERTVPNAGPIVRLPFRVSLYFLVPVFLAAPARGIVIRHDREDAAYRKLAEGYPMVCRVGDAMGTLIDPEWVLTAAHVASTLPRNNAVVQFEGRTVGVADIRVHPDFAVGGKHRDLALLRLMEPVTFAKPARLYAVPDEKGKRVTIVGNGQTGTGLTGPSSGPRVMRAAHNLIASVSPGWISFVFDAPDRGENLEGISGPGDSGGPAFIVNGDTTYVVGVSAYNDGDPPCVYGTTEHYSRVSDELEWLNGVMSGRIVAKSGPQMMRISKGAGGQATVTRSEPEIIEVPDSENDRFLGVLADLLAALNGDDQNGFLELFSDRFVKERRAAHDPIEGMHSFIINARSVRGDIVRLHQPGRSAIKIEDSRFPMRTATFHFRDGKPGYVGISIDAERKIDHFSLFVRESVCPNGSACTVARPVEEITAER